MRELTAAPKPATHAKDADFLRWLRQQPCLVCGNAYRSGFNVRRFYPMESRRYGDVENAVPLCGSVHFKDFASRLVGTVCFVVLALTL